MSKFLLRNINFRLKPRAKWKKITWAKIKSVFQKLGGLCAALIREVWIDKSHKKIHLDDESVLIIVIASIAVVAVAHMCTWPNKPPFCLLQQMTLWNTGAMQGKQVMKWHDVIINTKTWQLSDIFPSFLYLAKNHASNIYKMIRLCFNRKNDVDTLFDFIQDGKIECCKTKIMKIVLKVSDFDNIWEW